MTNLLSLILIGMLIGWLSGLLVRGRGFGLIGNLIVGVLGAVVGGFLFQLLGLQSVGLLATIVTGIVGAIVLLTLAGWARKQSTT